MAIELKQSTATTILFGPFLDSTDGVTPETGLATAMDNATTGIRLSKNGGNMVDRNDSNVPTHDEDGFYNVQIDATDTNTLGSLQLEYSDSTTCTPLRMDVQVVSANYWDTKYGADAFDVNVIQINGQTQVNPGASGGLFIAGTNAPVTITGSGNALTLQSTGSDGSGMVSLGNGTGNGLTFQGGSTGGHGMNCVGGAGDATNNAGDGIRAFGGASPSTASRAAGDGIRAVGGAGDDTAGVNSAGSGIQTVGGGGDVSTAIAGRGIIASAGTDGGAGGNAGMRVQAVGPGAEHAFVCAATGSGSGIATLGGPTNGHGLYALGDGTGNGIHGESGDGTTGDGIHGLASSTNGNGMSLTGSGTGSDLDALDASIPELGVAAPSSTPSIRTGIMLPYMALRNKTDVQTSGTDALEIHNDAGTLITSKLITDDGSDYSEAKMT